MSNGKEQRGKSDLAPDFTATEVKVDSEDKEVLAKAAGLDVVLAPPVSDKIDESDKGEEVPASNEQPQESVVPVVETPGKPKSENEPVWAGIIRKTQEKLQQKKERADLTLRKIAGASLRPLAGSDLEEETAGVREIGKRPNLPKSTNATNANEEWQAATSGLALLQRWNNILTNPEILDKTSKLKEGDERQAYLKSLLGEIPAEFLGEKQKEIDLLTESGRTTAEAVENLRKLQKGEKIKEPVVAETKVEPSVPSETEQTSATPEESPVVGSEETPATEPLAENKPVGVSSLGRKEGELTPEQEADRNAILAKFGEDPTGATITNEELVRLIEVYKIEIPEGPPKERYEKIKAEKTGASASKGLTEEQKQLEADKTEIARKLANHEDLSEAELKRWVDVHHIEFTDEGLKSRYKELKAKEAQVQKDIAQASGVGQEIPREQKRFLERLRDRVNKTIEAIQKDKKFLLFKGLLKGVGWGALFGTSGGFVGGVTGATVGSLIGGPLGTFVGAGIGFGISIGAGALKVEIIDKKWLPKHLERTFTKWESTLRAENKNLTKEEIEKRIEQDKKQYIRTFVAGEIVGYLAGTAVGGYAGKELAGRFDFAGKIKKGVEKGVGKIKELTEKGKGIRQPETGIKVETKAKPSDSLGAKGIKPETLPEKPAAPVYQGPDRPPLPGTGTPGFEAPVLKTYTVVRGDTFSEIVKRLTGADAYGVKFSEFFLKNRQLFEGKPGVYGQAAKELYKYLLAHPNEVPRGAMKATWDLFMKATHLIHPGDIISY